MQSNDIGIVEPILTICHDGLERNQNLLSCITNDQTTDFYRHYGDLLLRRKDLDGTLISMQTALLFTPASPDLHATAAELFFAKQDFPNGITHLNRAAELDKSYAVLWEHMGDQ